MKAEYHLIDLAYGVSHGGFRSLEAARQHAREEELMAWDIFHGNARMEYHDPRAEQSNQLASTALPYHLRCCDGPLICNLPPLLASRLGVLSSCSGRRHRASRHYAARLLAN